MAFSDFVRDLTNKAAAEMKERLIQMVGSIFVGFGCTFHSIGARLLRRHASLVGLSDNFTIIDPDDQLRVLKQILQLEGLDTKKQTAQYYAYFINLWKDRVFRQKKCPQAIWKGVWKKSP